MKPFQLGADVHENVAELRSALGSVTDDLSYSKLAALITEKHPSRKVTSTLVQRWEKDHVEPDIESIRIMAGMAGVTFEEFARGRNAFLSSAERLALANRIAAEIARAEVQGDEPAATRARTRFHALIRDTLAIHHPDDAARLADFFLEWNSRVIREERQRTEESTSQRMNVENDIK